MNNKQMDYGGQAVVEGVMFGGRHIQVTAIRRKNGEIETFESRRSHRPVFAFFKKIPLIRGMIALVDSSASGAKHLQFATDRYDLEADEDPEENTSRLQMLFGVAVVGVLSLIVGKTIFTALPAFLASILFDQVVTNLILQNLIEGAIKTLLLLGYLLAISQTSVIKRLFQYHGAEHKVINAYESGMELTIENVQKQSTLHYRCGSSFIILTVLVGVILYSFFSYDTVWDRILTRLLLLPVVIGLSYELLRFTNTVRDIPFLTYLGYPGLWLQKLTTREPDDDQVEVAISAFVQMVEQDNKVGQTVNQSPPACTFGGNSLAKHPKEG